MSEASLLRNSRLQFDPADAAAEARAIDRRIVANVAAESVDSSPEAVRVPVRQYTDPDRLAAEKRELFLKLPLMVGFSCDIPNAGDVMLFDDVGPVILIVRGRDGVVRAFLNMCRHRGAQVVTECASRKLLTCRFHGWSYDLDGRLVGLPARKAFEGAVDQANTNLVPVPCCEWAGMIFVKVRPGEDCLDAAEVTDFLGGMGQQLVRLNLPDCKPVKLNDRMVAKTNWKYVLDTYGESYHIAALHAGSFATFSISNCNLYDRFGPHWRVVFTGSEYGELVGTDESKWPVVPYGGSHFIFPSTCIYARPWGEGGTFLHFYRTYPGAHPGECITRMSSYRGYDMPASTPQQAMADVHDQTYDVIFREDYGVAAEGQVNLEHAPDGHTLVFGRNEAALQDMHRAWDEAVGDY